VRLTSTAAVLVLATLRAVAAAAEGPRVDPVVRRAVEYAAAYPEQLSLVRATEDYEQRLEVARRGGGSSASARVLVSDILWVPSSEDVVLLCYRDVFSVDGQASRDRGDRLLRLFPAGPSEAGRARALEILGESARFNLGSSYRNGNFPTLAISILHPRNQQRFRFRRGGESRLLGRRVVEIEYREVVHPTLTRSSSGKDFEARGAFWVTPQDGAILRSEMRYDSLPGSIQVSYRYEPRVGAFVPAEMSERYGSGNSVERIRGTAVYRDYLRGEAEVGPILYKK
jgi:hypothetical protein